MPCLERGPALSVLIRGDAFTFRCFRCEWSGSSQAWTSPKARLADFRPPRPADPGRMLELWPNGRLIEPGTVAASYLEARNCALPHPDGDLRWHPALRHPSGFVGPVLLALMTDAVTCAPLTLHRTWIMPDGSKANVDPPRLYWKGLNSKHGVVRLWPDAEITMGLCVAEGIETALSAAAGFGLAWACLDAWHLRTLPVLPGIDALTIVSDHDKRNPQTGSAPAMPLPMPAPEGGLPPVSKSSSGPLRPRAWTSTTLQGRRHENSRRDPRGAGARSECHAFPWQKPEPKETPAPLATRSMADLAELPVPALSYLAADWVPKAKAVLFAGMGGSGKTTLACQLGAARAIAMPFLGLHVDHGVTLALLCEDDADDAHRMLVRLADHFSRGLADFAGLPLSGGRRRRQCAGRPPPQWPRSCRPSSTSNGSNGSATLRRRCKSSTTPATSAPSTRTMASR